MLILLIKDSNILKKGKKRMERLNLDERVN